MSETEISFTIKPGMDSKAIDALVTANDKNLNETLLEKIGAGHKLGAFGAFRPFVDAFFPVRESSPALRNCYVGIHATVYEKDGMSTKEPYVEMNVRYMGKDDEGHYVDKASCRLLLADKPTGIRLLLDKIDVDEGLQQTGLSGPIMRAVKNFWQSAPGLKDLTMRMSTEDVGTYTWLKYGALPDQNSWNEVRQKIKKGLRYDSQAGMLTVGAEFADDNLLQWRAVAECKMKPKEYEALQGILDSDDPRQAFALSKMKKEVVTIEETAGFMQRHLYDMCPDALGKALLFCGKGWDGGIDPHDKDAMKRLARYTAAQIKKVQER